MAKVNQAEGLWTQLARTVVTRSPIVDDGRIKRGLVKLVLDKYTPVVGERGVNLAHTFEIVFQRAPKILLTGKVSTVADPNGVRLRAERSSNLNALDVVRDGL